MAPLDKSLPAWKVRRLAASKIQGVVRAKKGGNLLLNVARRVFEIGYDAESEEYFYYNKMTGESHWDTPLILRCAPPYRTDKFARGSATTMQARRPGPKPLLVRRDARSSRVGRDAAAGRGVALPRASERTTAFDKREEELVGWCGPTVFAGRGRGGAAGRDAALPRGTRGADEDRLPAQVSRTFDHSAFAARTEKRDRAKRRFCKVRAYAGARMRLTPPSTADNDAMQNTTRIIQHNLRKRFGPRLPEIPEPFLESPRARVRHSVVCEICVQPTVADRAAHQKVSRRRCGEGRWLGSRRRRGGIVRGATASRRRGDDDRRSRTTARTSKTTFGGATTAAWWPTTSAASRRATTGRTPTGTAGRAATSAPAT